jgi:hypothetical protein
LNGNATEATVNFDLHSKQLSTLTKQNKTKSTGRHQTKYFKTLTKSNFQIKILSQIQTVDLTFLFLSIFSE